MVAHKLTGLANLGNQRSNARERVGILMRDVRTQEI
jgi:hypothetical protein